MMTRIAESRGAIDPQCCSCAMARRHTLQGLPPVGPALSVAVAQRHIAVQPMMRSSIDVACSSRAYANLANARLVVNPETMMRLRRCNQTSELFFANLPCDVIARSRGSALTQVEPMQPVGHVHSMPSAMETQHRRVGVLAEVLHQTLNQRGKR